MAIHAGDDQTWWEGALAFVAEPGGGTLGPAQMRLAGWLQTRHELLQSDPGSAAMQATRQGFVLSRDQARWLGVEENQLRRHVRRGRWTVARRGVLCPLPVRSDNRPHGGSPEITVAAAALGRPGTVASHESAAILHGLPVLTMPARPVLTTARVSDGGGWRNCLLRACPTPSSERTDWFGTATTNVARTVVDVARSGGVAAGLVTADAALHDGLTTQAELLASVRRARRRPGVVAARRVVDLADGRAESPLESLTRLCVIDAGLPTFEPQVIVATQQRAYRVDLLCRRQRTVIEADGLRKYRLDPDALSREKVRQEAIERADYRVVRVTWDDVTRHPQATITRIRRALGPTRATVRPEIGL